MKKTLVIGAGNVGAHVVSCGVAKGVKSEFYLLDVNESLGKSQVLDLKDTLLFADNAVVDAITFDDYRIAEMDVIVITAGANQLPGETRVDLLDKNTKMLKDIAERLGVLKPSAVVILVANPVDIITKVAREVFDLPAAQVFGTGTLLDTARLRWRMSERLGINIRNVHGCVLGEHGDSQLVAWSLVSGGDKLNADEKTEIEKSVSREAYEIIEGKGATYFGIGAATIKIVDAVLYDTNEIFPISTDYPYFENEALRDTPIGVLASVGADGVGDIGELRITEEELEKLSDSAEKLYSLYQG